MGQGQGQVTLHIGWIDADGVRHQHTQPTTLTAEELDALIEEFWSRLEDREAVPS